jgi:hypothetical protein
MKLGGHLWTIAPNLRHRVRPRKAPTALPWSTALADPKIGRVELHGHLHPPSGACADELVVLVHGLGGSPDSQYVIQAAHAADRAGIGCLRLGLRGTDRSGADFYHAGLTEDLSAALASPELAGVRRIYILGFSLGGHTSLRFALRPTDPRVRAVATLCAPLDLHAGSRAIDDPKAWPYRRYLLGGLLEIYEQVAARRAVPTPLAIARRISTMREWDSKTVVPRFGFSSADDYYTSMSAGPRLGELALPALVVATEHDPMVPAWTLHRYLDAPPPNVTVRWLQRGGHVGFPRSAELGLVGGETVFDQMVAWLRQH